MHSSQCKEAVLVAQASVNAARERPTGQALPLLAAQRMSSAVAENLEVRQLAESDGCNVSYRVPSKSENSKISDICQWLVLGCVEPEVCK